MRLLLLHGAWAGPWVWDGLRAAWAGRRGVDTVDLQAPPGTDDADLVDRVVAAVDAAPGPVALVAHSGAAALAQSAAERRPDRVRALVSIAGIVLPPGAALAQLCAEVGLDARGDRGVGIGRWLRPTPDGAATEVPPEAAAAVFFADLDADTTVAAARRLVPQADAALGHAPVWTPGRAGALPHLYVEATLDRALPLDLQRHLQRRAGVRTVATLATGHAPHIGSPRRVRQVVQTFLTALPAPAPTSHQELTRA